MRRALALSIAVGFVVALFLGVTAAPAAPSTTSDPRAQHAPEVVEHGTLPFTGEAPAARARLAPAAPAQVGDQKFFLALDDANGRYFFAPFTLKAIGEHIEIWVQNDLSFPAGDCRNDGVRNVVTQDQLDSFVHEFDTNIYPKESEAFSVPPARDGSDAQLPDLAGLPPDYYAGDGDKILTLIENVRDTNYYVPPNVQVSSYIAGFFSSQLNAYFGRNTMTIDSYDWTHRTGANPPNNPSTDPCLSATARPHLYEGVFAHEYQHLLESYEDPDEFNWVNEGLSDWAQTLVGYVTPSTPITEIGFDSHIQCFLGWLSVQTPVNPIPYIAGPENSLTRWGDQGDDEILCDYGAAYTMMEFLHGRYGTAFMSALHRDDGNGFVGLQNVLDQTGNSKVKASDVLHDWSLMVALDGLIDDGAKVKGPVKEKDVTAPTLDATINWDNPEAYDSPGAPSNGADYVRLRDGSGNYLNGGQISSLSFQGATSLPPLPVQWSVDSSPPLGGADGAALYSGAGNNRDEAIVREVAVPTGAGAAVTFDALWNEELGWDFGFVQISTDGGLTYQSVACTDTTTDHDPGALPTAVQNVPGFTGFPGAWQHETCSLAAYAGQTVLLAFRTFNDPASLGQDESVPPGFWIDNVAVGSTSVSDGTTLDGWKSFSETRPTTVAGFTVYIVSMNTSKKKDAITVKQLPLTSGFAISTPANVQKYIDKHADFVAAIVMYDDPSETSTDYARYSLVVNGATQPGGS
jgi:hypothetical protein